MILKRGKKNIFLRKNLDYLLAQHSLDIKNLSIETGVPPATLSRLRKDGSNPTLSSIEPLLEFFRVDMDSFLYQDMSSLSYQNKKRMGDLVHISVYSIEEISKDRSKAKVSKFIGAAGITGKNVFGISINSEALAPAFQNNSIVIIDPDLKPIEGDYVLCCLGAGEDIPVFRQLFIDGNDYYFKPINPGFGEMKHYEYFKILGVVIKSIESYR
ncbi:LexA family transcriptional regulator [Legionella oakridgensis]|uniref:SOS-response transcriptional repressors n=2 Tax=Legionella oakridgensis TaxID=29423 RepID=W0BBX7_9GAMM|nr:LexA family transcriptional regulator [Legionella oakridgensis]AHE66196.1 SOS-response transcriptional repressors [Legionella oakridgensis ATCC 33761 = DSM 21215]ETO93988.1 SOS-response transcriptional repressor [Legionella oakridgensis RV-2-2007]KTD42335.1 HTH-type transcriptional regulator [Legionella oakridgensis]STY16103.1 HTH-type transcriptional regulator [Legionella longbeachae]